MTNTTIHSEYASTGQGYKLQHIEKVPAAPGAGHTVLRYTVVLDTSYSFQSHVYVEVLRPGGDWVRLADLYPPSFTDAPSVHSRVEGAQLAYCKKLVAKLRKVAVQILD